MSGWWDDDDDDDVMSDERGWMERKDLGMEGNGYGIPDLDIPMGRETGLVNVWEGTRARHRIKEDCCMHKIPILT